jgi:hypothetical protein
MTRATEQIGSHIDWIFGLSSQCAWRYGAKRAPCARPLEGRIMTRERLSRDSISFDFEVSGLKYTATASRFPDGRIGELFLNNHKSNSAADVNARDAAITFSIAIQHGADPEAIRKALCRNGDGSASGPLGRALDIIGRERGP